MLMISTRNLKLQNIVEINSYRYYLGTYLSYYDLYFMIGIIYCYIGYPNEYIACKSITGDV